MGRLVTAHVRALVLVAAWFSISTGAARAQRPLIADRPDFTESATTVGQGVFQIEFGYTFGLDGDGTKVHSHSLGEPLLRAGLLADRLEVRVAASPMWRRTDPDGGAPTGDLWVEDLYLGIKLALTEQSGILPAIAILPQTTLPTGGTEFSIDRALPGVNLVYGWDITEIMSLAAGTQVNRAAGDSGDTHPEWAQSVSGVFGLGARHGLYAEWFAFFHAEPAATWAEHYFNSGVTWLATNDLQWDVRAGFGLNDAAEDIFFGTGVSVRIR